MHFFILKTIYTKYTIDISYFMSAFCPCTNELHCNVSIVLRLGNRLVSLEEFRFWVQTILGCKSRSTFWDLGSHLLLEWLIFPFRIMETALALNCRVTRKFQILCKQYVPHYMALLASQFSIISNLKNHMTNTIRIFRNC